MVQNPAVVDGDAILPWLISIGKALDRYRNDPSDPSAIASYIAALRGCVQEFSIRPGYGDDARLLRVLALYGDAVQDFGEVFEIMEKRGVGIRQSIIYEAAAVFLVSMGRVLEAQKVYQLGISRDAEPIDRLKKMYSSFLEQISRMAASPVPGSAEEEQNYVTPWALTTISDHLRKMNSEIVKYDGYYRSTKNYSGKVALSSLQKSSRNKVIELGGRKYFIKGCAGQGGFALVFKANVDSNPDETVALKIQSPAFPWEFYMYRLLDKRISQLERPSFGFAHRVHVFADWSILVSDYLSHGTLQDAINSYVVTGKTMEEVLCIYYTIELLRMLENLHNVGIIHGDLKPDNLLIRYSRSDLTEHEFGSRTGTWSEEGLCLVDWGRGIDVGLFPIGSKFNGDSRTSGFRCIQMQEKNPWTYQVDTYGLCVIVHMMLHGQYMQVERRITPQGVSYQPKMSLKRYWKINLWKNLFSTLLNLSSDDNDAMVLQSLRKCFEDFMSKNPQLVLKLKDLLAKQKASLCSA